MRFLPRYAAAATVLTYSFRTTFAFYSVAFLAFTFGIPELMGALVVWSTW
jgi:hypothetical protein